MLLPSFLPQTNRRKAFSRLTAVLLASFFQQHDLNLISIPDTKHITYPILFLHTRLHFRVRQKFPHMEKIVVLMKQKLQDAIRSSYDRTTVNYLSTTILCELYSQFYQENNVSSQTKRTQKQMYYDIIDYVKQNTNINLKVADVAEHFGYNEKYLSHLFSKIAGIPLKQFILNVKMDAANFMLTDTNASISEIAASLGFTQP